MIGLPHSWQTERLLIQNVALAETGRLREVYNSCNYVEPWDKTFHLVSEEEIAGLVNNSLAFGRTDQNRFQMQSIRQKESGQIIGYFHLYHGRPHPHVAIISMFVIHRDHQKERVGQEVTAGLWQQLHQTGQITAVWLDVYLKNWPALRFWLANGFNTIIDYDGDPIHTDTSHANLCLEKKLYPPS
jgi:ribosomal protein S18 acetylase RimI-like enzyme